MMKNKKAFATIFCSVAFCFALSLAGCGSTGDTSSAAGGSGNSGQTTQIPSGSFQVTFETRGGTQIEAQTVKSGETATKPATDPTNPGQKFTGWFADFDAVTPFDFTSPITSTTVVYAGWEIDRDSFYGGGGGGGGSSQPQGQITYTCTSLPSWVVSDGCVVFAWAWPSGSQGAWYSATVSGTSLTFTVDQEMEGFLLARCAPGTTTPDWNTKGDNAGRVYNQTENISCSSGTHSYTCSSWKEYNPA